MPEINDKNYSIEGLKQLGLELFKLVKYAALLPYKSARKVVAPALGSFTANVPYDKVQKSNNAVNLE